MNSEKVKEIKKALEDNKTDHLPYIDGWKCKFVEYADILTLINELESENERFVEERDLYKEQFNELEPRFLDLQYDNQQLKDRIAELEKENDEQYKRIMKLEQDLVHADENVFYRECDVALQENKIKAEGLKQFAERLKEKLYNHRIWELPYEEWCKGNVVCGKIDETLKEFIDD